MDARRTAIRLIYDGTDISVDVSGDLVSFDYTDNESNTADDISVKLKNDTGLWSGAWFPGKGDTLKAYVLHEQAELYCGTFKIDELAYSGPPKTFDIKAVSVPLNGDIRRTAKSKTWEDIKLSVICQEIAAAGDLELYYDVENDPTYDRLSQREESDLKFLERICADEGYSLKITDQRLVVFDQKKYESEKPVAIIELSKSAIKSFSFKSQAFDLYKTCTVSYFDPEKEEELQETFTAPDVNEGMDKRVVKRAGSLAEAKRIARATLRKLNRHEITGELTLVGDTVYLAGLIVTIKGFGKYDGNYLIEKARHSVNNGYTVSLSIRRVLEGY